MRGSMREDSDEYLHQLSIQERCYHPSGTFIRFEKEDADQTIPKPIRAAGSSLSRQTRDQNRH